MSGSQVQPKPHRPGGEQAGHGELVCQVPSTFCAQQTFVVPAAQTMAGQGG